MGLGSSPSDIHSFLDALLNEDDVALKEAAERIGPELAIAAISLLLSILVAARFGSDPEIDVLSQYAKAASVQSDRHPRQMILEAVLRAGSGDDGILTGFSEDEILETTPILLSCMYQDLADDFIGRAKLVERAARFTAARCRPDTKN